MAGCLKRVILQESVLFHVSVFPAITIGFDPFVKSFIIAIKKTSGNMTVC